MKKYVWGIIAIVLVIGFSAFSAKKQSSTLAGEKWFVFNGDPTDPGDLGDASMYSLDGTGSSPTVCQSTTEIYRCEIFAVPQTGNTSLPNLSTIASETKKHNP